MTSYSCAVMLAIIFSVFFCYSVTARETPKSKPEMIKAICKTVRNVEGCRKIVGANPNATAAKDLISMASAVIGIGITHANETLDFIKSTIKTDPTVKLAFEKCANLYYDIFIEMKIAAGSELKEDPMSANNYVMVTKDDTLMTMNVLGGAKGGASVNTLKEKTVKMNNFIDLAVGATNAVVEYYVDH